MKDRDSIVEQLKTTPIVQVACQKAGISRASYYRWREDDADFKEKTNNALKDGVDFINDLAESQLIGLIKDRHPTSIYYWLNNHHSSYTQRRILLSPNEQAGIEQSIKGINKQSMIASVLLLVFKGLIPIGVAGTLINSIGRYKKNKDSEEMDAELERLRQFIERVSEDSRENPTN